MKSSPQFFRGTMVLILAASILATAPAIAATKDLLIISPSEFVQALHPLVAYKERTGIRTQLLRLEDIQARYRSRGNVPLFDDPERIKYAIYRAFKDSGIRYVMLVGDANVMPVRYIRGELDDYSPDFSGGVLEKLYLPSDLYYADLVDAADEFETWDHDTPPNGLFGEIYRGHINWDNIDYRPDVALGRIPASDVLDVRNYVAKVIRYEMTAAAQQFTTKLVLSVRGNESVPAFTESLAQSRPEFSVVRLYNDDLPDACIPAGVVSDDDPTPDNLVNAFNSGTGWFYHSGHGNPYGWNGSFTVADVARLDNKFQPAVIFVISCDTSRYCPRAPYDSYLGVDGMTYGGGIEIGDIGSTIYPEPAPIQPVTYHSSHCIGEELTVGSEAGAVGYWGCFGTGEAKAQTLAKHFFAAYAPGTTLGDLWRAAMEGYYRDEALDQFTHDSSGDSETMWRFHNPERFPLFGDPSLRIGGVTPAEQDFSPPVTAHNVSPTRYWVGNPFNLVLTPTDEGSGVYATFIRAWNEDFREERTRTVTAPAGTTLDARYEFFSTDFFHNEETPQTVDIHVDGVAPDEPTLTLDGPSPIMEDTDFSGTVDVTLSSADAHSGLQCIEYLVEHGTTLRTWTRYTVVKSGAVGSGESFAVSGGGDWRVSAWAVDQVGNHSAAVTREFRLGFVIDPEYMRFWNLVRILSGLEELRLSQKLELPFKPFEVAFYARPVGGGGWTLLGRDLKAEDGWGWNWQTTTAPDGLYELQAIALPRGDAVGQTATLTSLTLPLMTCAVGNNSAAYGQLVLDEVPRIVGRGQRVLHRLRFTNTSQKPLHHLVLEFPSRIYPQYHPASFTVGSGGTIDGNGTLRWTNALLNAGASWEVEFRAAAALTVPSHEPIRAFGYLSCAEIPVLMSDDPATPLAGDPTQFTVEDHHGKVTGQILAQRMLEPVANARVLANGHLVAVTDETGTFTLSNVLAGSYSLVVEHPPDFVPAQATVAVDGKTVRTNFYLQRQDVLPPSVCLSSCFEEHVLQGRNAFAGTLVDELQGSGAAGVNVALRRLSDGYYWNGGEWQPKEARFGAEGTTAWTIAFPGLTCDSAQAYELRLQGFDRAGNTAVRRCFSRPPAPTCLSAKLECPGNPASPILLRWNPVPGCNYWVEVSDHPFFATPLVEQGTTNTQLRLDPLPRPGQYYARVSAVIGDHLFSLAASPVPFSTSVFRPTLRVESVGGSLVLSWAAVTGLELQVAAAVPDGPWHTESTPPELFGNTMRVRLPLTAGAAFYRLHRP